MPVTLDTETTNIIRCAKPMVAALNSLLLAQEEATDILLDETDEEFDDHPLDPMRDLASDLMDELLERIEALICDKNIQVKFNRVDGLYTLMEKL
jgi:hypothetical protein